MLVAKALSKRIKKPKALISFVVCACFLLIFILILRRESPFDAYLSAAQRKYDDTLVFSDDFFTMLNFMRLSHVVATESGYRVQHDAERFDAMPSFGAMQSPGVEWVPPLSPERFSDAWPKGPAGYRQQLKNLSQFFSSEANWMNCNIYETPRRRATVRPEYKWKKFYIAINLFNNEQLIPYLTEALVAFIEDELSPFFSVKDSVVVSVYSNVSPDATGVLIREMLVPRLQQAGVKKIYVTTDGVCLGHSTKTKTLNRIHWLSCCRNKVMEPLYDMGMNVFLDDPLSGTTSNSTDLDEEDFVVVFINDVYFLAEQITRLLETRTDKKLDPFFSVPGEIHGEKSVKEDSTTLIPDGGRVTGFDMTCGIDFYDVSFYDRWVTRDLHGVAPTKRAPYFTDDVDVSAFYSSIKEYANKTGEDTNPKEKRLRGTNGIPVMSCWNGIVAIRGRFFLSPKSKAVKERMDKWKKPASRHRDIPSPDHLPLLLGSHRLYPTGRDQQDAACECKNSDGKYIRRPSGEVLEKVGYDEAEALAEHWLHVASDLVVSSASTVQDWKSKHHFRHGGVNREADRFRRDIRKTFFDAWESGIVYRTLYPALRFRYNLIPSYGAMASNRMEVATTTCYSSECLLLCQDIAQLLYIQEQRAAVILLNPNVPVFYLFEDFKDPVPTHSFKMFPKLLRIQHRLCTFLFDFFLGYGAADWRSRSVIPLSAATPLEYVESKSVSLYDDWELTSNRSLSEISTLYAPLRKEWVRVDLNAHLQMTCDLRSHLEFKLGLLLWRLGLFVVTPVIMCMKMIQVFSRARNKKRVESKILS